MKGKLSVSVVASLLDDWAVFFLLSVVFLAKLIQVQLSFFSVLVFEVVFVRAKYGVPNAKE